MNFKKSLLSLVTIVALNNTVLADDTATYLPLASDTVDSTWILFGVNGFSTGIASDLSSLPSSFTAGKTELEDTVVSDYLATSGLNESGNPLASLQALADAVPSISTLSIGVDITGVTYDAAEAVRSMYIQAGTSTTPNIKFNYKASLEGKTIEILLDDALYTATISQQSTWDNPAVATSGTTSSSTTDRSAITEVLDFNFSDNPAYPKHFSYTDHLLTTGQTASFYHFNALTQQWEVWQKGAATGANDFTSFAIGDAYWGRADRQDSLGAQVIDTNGSIGLVLGEATQASNLPDPDRYNDETNTSKLTTGWNMLAFDNNQPYIRHAATGLVLTTVNAGVTLAITDDSGINSIALGTTLPAIGGDMDYAIAANKKIESYKQRNMLSDSFNVKVYQGDANGTLIFISDKKFSISELNATNSAIGVTSLQGANPYINGVQTLTADLDGAAGPATSVYGEYTALVEVMVGSGSVDHNISGGLGGIAQFSFTDTTNGTESAALTDGVASSLATAEAQFEALAAAPVATQIDTTFDGTADMLIVAHDEQFSLKDLTYTRVFTVDNTAAVGAVYPYSGTTVGTATTVVTPTTASVSKAIDDLNGTTSVYSDVASDGKLIAISTANSNFDVKDDVNGSNSILSSSSSTTNLAKGAIKGVYSLDHIARIPVGQWTQTINAFTAGADGNISNDALDDINVSINSGEYNSTIALSSSVGAAIGAVTTYGGVATMFDNVVSVINELITSAGLHGYAAHNYTVPATATSGTALSNNEVIIGDIVVTGVDIEAVGVTFINQLGPLIDPTVTETGDNNVTLGNGDIVADLKTNAARTKDFAEYGPLYTLRDSGTGYSVMAMLKATTETNGTTGAIAWDSIDLTRNEADWFANNEFNLFSINHNSGYWVYLEDKAADTVAIGTASFSASPSYTYYFSNTLTSGYYPTENVMNGGTITVTITGLNDATGEAGSAYASIGGETIRLERTSSSSNSFTANVSKYALASFNESSTAIPIDIRAVNGKGEAVYQSTAVSIDYAKPTNVTATVSGGTSLILGADGNDTENFYVFSDVIPEVKATRDAAIVATLPATNSAATFNACSQFNFGTTNTLRIVVADGTIDSANLSNAKQVVYASLLKGAHVLTHDETSSDLKQQIGVLWDSTCTQAATQPSAVTDNNGVSLATLASGQTSRMSFVPITNANFTQSVPFTANYSVAGTAVIQVQNVEAYAGESFFVEYGGALYSATFPATKALADASILTPIALTALSTAVNTTLAP